MTRSRRTPAAARGLPRTGAVVRVLLLAPTLLAALAPGGRAQPAPGTDSVTCDLQLVPAEVVESAIRTTGGYDIAAAPNQGRFLAELLLELARRFRDRAPEGPPFVLRQEEFFPAFLRVTGLSPAEAPPAFRKAHRYGQRMFVEYVRERVLERMLAGPEPRQALAVRAAWPDTGALPASYAYRDTASDPDIRVRHERDVTYRLLEFVGIVAYDRMEGVSGRPTSGALGALFDVVGMAEIEESRFVPAGNDAQVTFTRVRKVVPLEAVATITADGRARRGLPRHDPRFERLREIVTRELDAEYAGAPPPACFGETPEGD